MCRSGSINRPDLLSRKKQTAELSYDDVQSQRDSGTEENEVLGLSDDESAFWFQNQPYYYMKLSEPQP